VYPIFFCKDKKEMYTYAKSLTFAVLLCILGFLPFAIQNALVTKNPFFPLLNNVFNSPYASVSMQSLVTEMSPFSISIERFLFSFIALLKSQAVFWGGLLFFGMKSLRDGWRSDRLALFISAFSLLNFILLLVCMGPYGGAIEDRHFLIPIACFILLSILAVQRFVKGRSYEKHSFFVIFFVALMISHFDSSLKSDFNFFRKEQLTQDFFSRKSLIQINAELSLLQQKSLKILNLTGDNMSYFLEHGVSWHKSYSYPVLFWNFQEMSEKEWIEKIKEHRITHLIVPKKGEGSNYLNLEKVLVHKIISSLNEDVYDVNALSGK
jgi:hypothetical protein